MVYMHINRMYHKPGILYLPISQQIKDDRTDMGIIVTLLTKSSFWAVSRVPMRLRRVSYGFYCGAIGAEVNNALGEANEPTQAYGGGAVL